MKYAKLINDNLQYAPNKIILDDAVVYNPSGEMLIDLGYLPVIYTDPPTTPDNYVLRSEWIEQNDAIVQTWTLVKNTLVAPKNIEKNEYFILDGAVYLSTAAIPHKTSVVPGMNCTEVSLVDALNIITSAQQ